MSKRLAGSGCPNIRGVKNVSMRSVRGTISERQPVEQSSAGLRLALVGPLEAYIRRRHRAICFALLIVPVVGCASQGRIPTRQSRDAIVESEIAASRAQNAYDLVARLRPAFLTSRGPTSIRLRSTPQADVFLDNVFFGDIRSLRTITVSDISEVRYFPAYEAMQRFGSGHMGGVIQVLTKQ